MGYDPEYDDEVDPGADTQVLTPAEMEARLQTRLILDGSPEEDHLETAQPEGDSWWVAEWERYEMSGQPYWRETSGYRIQTSVVARLAAAQRGPWGEEPGEGE